MIVSYSIAYLRWKGVKRIKVESKLRLEKCAKNNLVHEAEKDNDPIGVLYVKKKALESRPLTIRLIQLRK